MKIKMLVSIVLALAAACAAAAGKPLIVVEGVQMPAWVEHASGKRSALAVGAMLRNKDRIVTGEGSRALLRMSDGSLIRLGQNGTLVVDDLAQQKFKMKDVMTATLDVLAGAFRYTTQALPRARVERDVKIRVVTITVGLRGTDLWARPETARDIVCLIEGNVDITRGDQAFTMAQPMSFYVAPKDKPGEPVGPVSREQLDKWTAETDLPAGALRKDGKWRVYLADASDQDAALRVYDELHKAGYPAQIRPVTTDAGTTYLATRADAAAFGEKVKGRFGVAEPKVSK
jgi:hypothetical protein